MVSHFPPIVNEYSLNDHRDLNKRARLFLDVTISKGKLSFFFFQIEKRNSLMNYK